MSKGYAANARMTLLAVGVLTCFVAVGVRLVFLHVLDRDELLQFVDKARRQILVEPARRGAILDANGNMLATSRSFVVLGIDPEMVREQDAKHWPELARLLKLPRAQLEQDIRRAVAANQAAAARGENERRIRWVKLADEVDEAAYDQVRALRIAGVYGNRDYRRVYPSGQLAAHLLGYLNREGTPVTGAERHFDLYLRGQDGWIESEKNGARRELAQFRTRDVPPQDGSDVVLTIDSVIQNMIERELDGIATKYSPHFATIIVSDPATGAILGLANYPSYDLNNYAKAPMEAQRNYAVTDVIEPGSTFKIVAAGAALNEGLVTPNTTFDCSQTTLFYRGKERKLPKEDHDFGLLTVGGIVSRSSNRGAAQLAALLGERRFYDYAKAFGFGETTGLQVGGEVRGTVHDPKDWDGLTITRMPMGHAVAATPLQIHMAMSAIANLNGELLRPQLIREIRDRQGNVVRRFDPEVRRTVLSPRVAALERSLLQAVVSPDGTAAGFEIPGFELAGKTGTTQKIIDGRYVNNRHVASFVGFFPASRPRVVLSVIVDDAKVASGNAYGRAVSAPVFKSLAEQLIQYLDIKPVLPVTRNFLALNGGSR